MYLRHLTEDEKLRNYFTEAVIQQKVFEMSHPSNAFEKVLMEKCSDFFVEAPNEDDVEEWDKELFTEPIEYYKPYRRKNDE